MSTDVTQTKGVASEWETTESPAVRPLNSVMSPTIGDETPLKRDESTSIPCVVLSTNNKPHQCRHSDSGARCLISGSGNYTIKGMSSSCVDRCQDDEDDGDEGNGESDDFGTARADKSSPYGMDSPLSISVVERSGLKITKEMLRVLRGFPIVIEGGIGQGKTSLAHALTTELAHFGITSSCRAEPTDTDALNEFMKYQKPLPTTASPKEKATFAENAARAAINMQFSMMRRRCDQMSAAAIDAQRGEVPIIDRGPFGDAVFMGTTFRKYHVSSEIEIAYIVEFQRRYMSIQFPRKNILIVRVRAPTPVSYARWLEREKPTDENKYSIEYLQKLEEMYDSCSRAWTHHVVYDNAKVRYFPGDPSTNTRGHPDEAAIKDLLFAMCACASRLKAEAKQNMWKC